MPGFHATATTASMAHMAIPSQAPMGEFTWVPRRKTGAKA